eukprot:TRINITY_DN70854_c0_g1_i1.p1 TRINITY_DN70854_c0_g1~~TRINITY_DN70854_c0_g1_i1.p1  ORF type:complete len:408 (-),score=66.75 TRINITY_DN70854_c0_g1_i1:72-1295(-)
MYSAAPREGWCAARSALSAHGGLQRFKAGPSCALLAERHALRSWRTRRPQGGVSIGPSRRWAASLPQIPGVIMTNNEIADDSLIRRVRQWAASSEGLSKGAFDLVQLSESADGRLAPRALCGLLRTRLALAGKDGEEAAEPVRALVTVFYKSRDYLNREFWEDQIRRLCDVVAEEYLGGHRGVQLMVHHRPPSFALGLELGVHRLLVELDVLHVVGPIPASRTPSARGVSLSPEWLPASPWSGADQVLDVSGHSRYNRLCFAGDVEGSSPSTPAMRGRYVLRDADGSAVCGLEVLGVQALRLVCSSAWASPGHEVDLAWLLDAVRKKSRRLAVSLLSDKKDPYWERICGSPEAARIFGMWRTKKPAKVAVTGAPVGLTAEEQVRLARAPLLVPWEFLSWDSGSVVVI